MIHWLVGDTVRIIECGEDRFYKIIKIDLDKILIHRMKNGLVIDKHTKPFWLKLKLFNTVINSKRNL